MYFFTFFIFYKKITIIVSFPINHFFRKKYMIKFYFALDCDIMIGAARLIRLIKSKMRVEYCGLFGLRVVAYFLLVQYFQLRWSWTRGSMRRVHRFGR